METLKIVAGGRSLGEEEGGGVISGAGEARTILLLLHIISARPFKQPLMVRTFLKVYMELGSYFVSARTNKRHHHHLVIVLERGDLVFFRPKCRGLCDNLLCTLSFEPASDQECHRRQYHDLEQQAQYRTTAERVAIVGRSV